MKYVKIIFTILIFSILCTINLTYGCSCGEPITPSEEYERMDVVFSGIVTNIIFDSSSYIPKKVFFDVFYSWKGNIGGNVVVWTANSEAECGYDFKINLSYLVYGKSWEDSISTNICTRTNLLQWASEDLEFLESLSNIYGSKISQPSSITLYQNYPNPFNSTTNIVFYLDKKSEAELALFNLSGKLVRIIISDTFNQGMNSIIFHAKNLSSGIYFYRLLTKDQIIINKMLLIQ